MKDFWNQRYASEDYVYGVLPNQFYKEELDKIKYKGKILLPAEGEGRNAVYAATQGWEVTAFDISEEGRKKALKLARKNNVEIDYQIGEHHKLSFQENHFDVIGLIFSHMPSNLRSEVHKKLIKYLKHDGAIILEAYSKDQLNYQKNNPHAGGPKDPDLLFSQEEIKNDFSDLNILQLSKQEVELKEGKYHIGKSSVVRLVAKKK